MTDQNTQGVSYYYLSDIVGTKVINKDKKIGRLADLLVVESGKLPQITNLYISRSFGASSLLIPWVKVKSLGLNEIIVNIDDVKTYEKIPDESDVLLKDHILDKKIIDTKDRDVEIAYDVRLMYKESKLYVSDVDLSKSRMLRRLGLKKLADFFQYLAGKMRNQQVSWEYIQHLPTGIGSFKGDLKLKVLKERLARLHPVDLAHILENLSYEQRAEILETLDLEQASLTLEEFNPNIKRGIAETLPLNKISQLLLLMTTGQIADFLSTLPFSKAEAILQTFDSEKAEKIKSLMDQQNENIQALATSKIIICKPTMTIAQAKEKYQTFAKGKVVVMYLYIVNDDEQLLGILDIKELLAADNNATLQDVMTTNPITLRPNSTYNEAARLFAMYDFRSIPLCNRNNKLLGAITYKDFRQLKRLFPR